MKDIKLKEEAGSKGLDLFSREFPVPTPEKSGWTERLKTLVRNAGVDRGRVEVDSSESDSQSHDDGRTTPSRKKEFISDETLFKKLKNNPSARSKLSSIHSARAHKYGHVQFGPKSWYKEVVNISEKLTSQEDRRKFRQGLKCNVEFLNQLNMHDLTKTLLEGKQKISSLPKAVQTKVADIFECLENIPLIDILKFIDNEKANKIFSLIDKITALAHVSQSMGNYFARDDSLDPALSIVCQALRGNIDFELLLRSRGGTFQSLASAYYHLKSPVDHDLTGSTHTTRARRSRRRNFRDPPRQTAYGPRSCWYFQRHGRCSKRDCVYSHRCSRCGSKNHGEKTCRSDRGTK